MAGVTPPTRVGYCYDPRMREHKHLGYDHPEQPARITSIFETLEISGCTSRMIVLPAREVSEDEVTLVHSRRVWERVSEIESMTTTQIRSKYRSYTAKSLFANHKTPSSVRLSCGATIEAAMAVAEGRCKRSVAIVRPPGHHAEPNKSMGFCFFNNVAVAAKAILQKTAIKKILILDWDVHHGNGVQAAFEDDPNVLYISIHRYENAAFYPNDTSGSYSSKGKGRGLGFSVNIPWAKGGKGDEDYFYAFEKVVMPVAREFAPEIVLISAGFDAAEGDPLGECNVTPLGFARMASELCSLSDGRVVAVLEGGYNLTSTSDSMLAVTKVLLGDPLPSLGEIPGPSRSTAKTISDVRRVHESHWKCFQTDKRLDVSTPASHRPSTTIPQKKRKRRDSDGDYTPHQKPDGNQSASYTTRRTSKRLAAPTQSEQQLDATISTVALSAVTRRSSSSTSTLTSASFSSFDRPPTPKEPDTPYFPIYSKPQLEKSPVLPVILPLDADCWSKPPDRMPAISLKIGFPSKDRREPKDRTHSTLTSRHLIKPIPSSPVKFLQEQKQQQQRSSPPRQTQATKPPSTSKHVPQLLTPADHDHSLPQGKGKQIGLLTVRLLETPAPQ